VTWDKVTEWDEYGQGYNAEGKLVVCICGVRFASYLDYESHYCPYDETDDHFDASNLFK
jgi:hypothetical protein